MPALVKGQEEFVVHGDSSDWNLVFSDPGTENWQEHWFLDGELATVENSDQGMHFSAGPVNRNDAHHAVLWTKSSFQGDLKIEYNYTRTDDQSVNVNILYIQATGTGEGQFDKDIAAWRDYRKVPTMSKYYNNMNAIHISYAAFPMVNSEPENDYIRVRRYPATEKIKFADTEVPPAYFKTGLFKPGLTYHLSWLKTEDQLTLEVSGPEESIQYQWDLSDFPPISEGRIGLRHMFTRAARYSDFKVYTKK
ncbi:hypothetical protein OKW21_004599 [Catalinimonas alkaloidigena]|uniref:DUF1961 family protein n=1 Tax=Catalinimonas alkaloidigena TaxID=1075417 RepID=UPI0024053A6D|nr:DUF1961 family protein [Catalinimonas alkaloidigena]MDF9799336.1 hypothetical protein [Catalinimonas alkaloidigena]